MQLPDLKTLFATKPKAAEQVVPAETTQAQLQKVNPDAIQHGESYESYGKRVCGKVNGQVGFLMPFLQRVYNSERQKQADNEEFQKQAKLDIQNKITRKQGDIEKCNNEIDTLEHDIERCDRNIEEHNAEVDNLKEAAEHGSNKMAKLKMTIGIIILIPLTLYLFLFYSSTIYSAFFRDFSNGDVGIGTAMFDPQAIPEAFNMGIGALLFVTTAPVIFLALGFCLHFFTMQKGIAKYFKMAAIICVTFFFDCILAYLIGKSIYDVKAMFSPETLPEYNINMAIVDVHIWAVIFCGFIVYIIWGIAFDMTVSAYDDYKSNTSAIESLQRRIAAEKEKQEGLTAQKHSEKIKKIECQHELNRLQQSLAASVVHYNCDAIQDAVTQFYSGWVIMMHPLNPTQIDEANKIYDTALATFSLTKQE